MIHKLTIDSICLEFNNRKILSDIYIKSETGKITGLLGRNGQGKSCLMKIIYGSLESESKSVRIDNVSYYSIYKRPDLLIYLPQLNFIPLSFTLRKVFNDYGINLFEFQNIFPEFQYRNKITFGRLSGGQKRLVEVYLFIKVKTKFVMMDEPFSQLMPLHVEKIIGLIKKEKTKKGFIITDHLYKTFIDFCDDLYVLKDGKTNIATKIEDLERLGYIK